MSDRKPVEEKDASGKSYYYAQVDFYLNAGEYSLALLQAGKNIAYNEHDPAAYVNRARVYEKLGRFDEAIRDLEEAVRIEPENEAVRAHLAELSAAAAKP